MALLACSPCSISCSQHQRSIDSALSSSAPRSSLSPSSLPQRRTFLGRRLVSRSPSELSSNDAASSRKAATVCSIGDFVGGDLIGLDLGEWCDDVENYGAIGFYSPPEGGAECRYATSLKYRGYHFMNISARGLGDPEAYLLKPHGIRPPHLGKQAVARFYMPGEVNARLAVLPARYKGIVLWIGECKVLSKNELQFLALLPALRPQVKVVCEMGGSRKFYWKPLKDLVGLPATAVASAAKASPLQAAIKETAEKKEEALA